MDDPKDDKEKQEEDEDPFWSLALQDPHEVAAIPVEGYKIGQEDSDSDSSGDGNGDGAQQRQSSIIEEGRAGGKFVKYQLTYISSSSSNAAASAAAAGATVSTTPITLELASLPMDDGIMGPVGGDAWYASALLTAMILQGFKGNTSTSRFPTRQQEAGGDDDDDHEDQDTSKDRAESSCEAVTEHTTTSSFGILPPQLSQRNNYKVLELGSGAVALPGISCAVALEKIRWQKQTQKQKQQEQKDQGRISNRGGDDNDEQHDNNGNNGNSLSWQIYLTDNDSDVLEQLKRNVNHNMSKILPHREPEIMNKETSLKLNPSSSSASPVTVSHLDWDLSDGVDVMDGDDDGGNSNGDSNNDSNNSRKQRRSADTILDGVDLVIGSELVYTEITGRALLKILKQLLRRNPNVVIWIVQVIDRYGWTEIVLPGLEKDPCVKVESFDTIPIEIHQVASSLIPMGGTLDRYAFGAVCITNVL